MLIQIQVKVETIKFHQSKTLSFWSTNKAKHFQTLSKQKPFVTETSSVIMWLPITRSHLHTAPSSVVRIPIVLVAHKRQDITKDCSSQMTHLEPNLKCVLLTPHSQQNVCFRQRRKSNNFIVHEVWKCSNL